MAQNYTQWEIKQILDITSKGINSVLMNGKKIPSPIKLRQLGMFLTELYKEILGELKNPDVKELSPDLSYVPLKPKEAQVLQDKADELKEEAIKEKEIEKANEVVALAYQEKLEQ